MYTFKCTTLFATKTQQQPIYIFCFSWTISEHIYIKSTNKKRTFLFHGMVAINQIKIYLKYKGIELATNFFTSISAISLLASFSTATCAEAQIKTKYNHRMHPYKVNIYLMQWNSYWYTIWVRHPQKPRVYMFFNTSPQIPEHKSKA